MSNESKLMVSGNTFAGLDRLGRHLGFHSRRQEVIAANLANIDTPGYRARDLVFHEELEAQVRDGALHKTMRHADEMVRKDDEVPDQDGNSVSLEHQMARTVANQLRYSTLNEVLNRKIGLLKYAASDGRA